MVFDSLHTITTTTNLFAPDVAGERGYWVDESQGLVEAVEKYPTVRLEVFDFSKVWLGEQAVGKPGGANFGPVSVLGKPVTSVRYNAMET